MSDLARVIMGSPDADSVAPNASMRFGTVTQVSPLLVTVGAGVTGMPCSVIAGYGPVVGDYVAVLVQGADRLCIGFVGAARANAGCRLSKATQTVANATAVALLWTAEEFDSNNLHSTVTNTSRITIPTGFAGMWGFGYQFELASFGAGIRDGYMTVNGGSNRYGWSQISHSTANVYGTIGGSADIKLAAGDYVEVFVYQSSGGAMNIGVNNLDRFWATYRGPA